MEPGSEATVHGLEIGVATWLPRTREMESAKDLEVCIRYRVPMDGRRTFRASAEAVISGVGAVVAFSRRPAQETFARHPGCRRIHELELPHPVRQRNHEHADSPG